MNRNDKIKRFIKFIPMILMMAVIFLFSCKQGDDSSEQSGRILQAIIKIVENFSSGGISDEMLGYLHLFIRKAAHFTEYALLGVTIIYAIYDFFKRKALSIPVSFLIAVLYASSDEVHQYFVPGRYGTPMDVLIDSCGAITGIVISFLIFRKKKNES